MAEFQEILDFPPAPKLNVFGTLDPKKATESELRGEKVFFGKGPLRRLSSGPVLHGQHAAQHAGGAIFQAADG